MVVKFLWGFLGGGWGGLPLSSPSPAWVSLVGLAYWACVPMNPAQQEVFVRGCRLPLPRYTFAGMTKGVQDAVFLVSGKPAAVKQDSGYR